MTKKIISMLLCVLVFCALTVPAWAHPVPDLTAEGSVRVHLSVNGQKLEGGALTFYQVGVLSMEDGNASFVPTEAFSGWGSSFSDVSSAETAKSLFDYADREHLRGTEIPVKQGEVLFPVEKGALGLYLVCQKKGCKGYAPLDPFLISVPNLQDGVYVYEVDASPKIGTVVPPPRPLPPEVPDTGQENLPIPILTVLGVLLITAGALVFLRGKKNHEA